MTTKQIITHAILLFVLYSCSSDKERKVKEVYYRQLTPGASYHENQNGKREHKTIVAIILENDSGFVFDDFEDTSKIDDIIKNKVEQLNAGIDPWSLGTILHLAARKQIDSNNFILTINNQTSHYNIIYKCNLTEKNELKTKLFMMDKGDTIPVCETGNGSDTIGIYYFKKWQPHDEKIKLTFKNHVNSIKRDISQEIPAIKKNGATYSDEIANFVKVQKLDLNATPLIQKYQTNKLAIELTFTGPTVVGSEIYNQIIIQDKTISILYRTRGSTEIYYSKNRLLTNKELDMLNNAIKFSNVSSSVYKLPVADKSYNSQSVDIFLKHNDKIAIGGFLYPLELTRSLRSNYPAAKSYEDCVKYSSTLNGNTDTLVKTIYKCFDKLDSLTKVTYGMKN